MTVVIFANGELERGEWVRPYLAQATAVIAADGGARHLFRLDHRPDVVIGDMDSLPDAVADWLALGDVQMIRHPAAKDETDLELALLFTAENFADDLLIFGALGGRLDQLLANVLLLAHPGLDGRPVSLVSQWERAWLVDGRAPIRGEVGDTVSLILLGGRVMVAETSGLLWPLRQEVLDFGPARGISNVLTAEMAEVVVGDGRLLCVHTKQRLKNEG